MRIKVLILLGWLCTVTVWAQQSEVRNVGSFEGVKSEQAIDVYLKKGDKESVKVEVTGESLSNVITEVSGTILRIRFKSNSFFRGKSDVKVYVTYVIMEKIVASSASNVFSDGVIKTRDMEIHGSSAAEIEVSLEANEVRVQASSAAHVTLEGKASSIDGRASSSGDINAYSMQVESATANASSGGGIKLNVQNALDAGASSGGSIRYRGNPMKTNTHSSSGGSVKKSN